MLEWLHDLLSNNLIGPELTFLGWFHILYIVLDLALIGALCTFFLVKDKITQEKFMWGLTIFILVSYLTDLALQPIIYLGEAGVWEAIINKLPFHLCTLNALLLPLAMVVKKEWFKNIIVAYAFFGGTLFLIAPQTYVQGGYSPFCYQVIQTFVYHGAMLCWAVFALFSRFVKPKLIDALWAELSLPAIAAWAEIGNLVFYTPTRNFLFLHIDITGLTTGYWHLALYPAIGVVVFLAYFAFFDFIFPKIAEILNLEK